MADAAPPEDIRSAASDRAILDALVACCTYALAAELPEPHRTLIREMQQGLTLARDLAGTQLVAGLTDALEPERAAQTKALVTLVLSGLVDRSETIRMAIYHGVRSAVDPASPLGIAVSTYHTLDSTARAYLVQTEGGH